MNEQKKLNHELNRFYSIWRDSLCMYEEWSKKHDLSYNNVMALISIRENKGKCTQKMIAEKWALPKQTINTILKGLEQRGLITLTQSSTDKRSKLILFTPSGEEYADKIVTELLDLELFAMSELGSDVAEKMNDAFALYVELFRKGDKKLNAQS